MANKIYLAKQLELNNYLSKSGGTLTGGITIQSGDLNMNSNKIVNIGTQTNNNDAVTKQYVDNLITIHSTDVQLNTSTNSIPVTIRIHSINFPNDICLLSVYLISPLDISNVPSLFYVTYRMKLPTFVKPPSISISYETEYSSNPSSNIFGFASSISTDNLFISVFEKHGDATRLFISSNYLLCNFVYHS